MNSSFKQALGLESPSHMACPHDHQTNDSRSMGRGRQGRAASGTDTLIGRRSGENVRYGELRSIGRGQGPQKRGQSRSDCEGNGTRHALSSGRQQPSAVHVPCSNLAQHPTIGAFGVRIEIRTVSERYRRSSPPASCGPRVLQGTLIDLL